jgi:hypothetical protein
MPNRIIVDIGDKVRNVHTDEIFIVETIFRMIKIEGGKYTSNRNYELKQLLPAEDWEIVSSKGNGNV